jgi:hypothetical protein
MLSSYALGPPSGCSPGGFPIRILYAFLVSSVLATSPECEYVGTTAQRPWEPGQEISLCEREAIRKRCKNAATHREFASRNFSYNEWLWISVRQGADCHFSCEHFTVTIQWIAMLFITLHLITCKGCDVIDLFPILPLNRYLRLLRNKAYSRGCLTN